MHARHHYFTLAVKTYWATPTKLIRAHCEFFLLYSKKFTLHHLYEWALRYHFGLIIFLITPFKFFDSFLILSNRCLGCLIYYFLVETSPCFCLCILRLHAISNNYIYIVDMADEISQGITLYSHVFRCFNSSLKIIYHYYSPITKYWATEKCSLNLEKNSLLKNLLFVGSIISKRIDLTPYSLAKNYRLCSSLIRFDIMDYDLVLTWGSGL